MFIVNFEYISILALVFLMLTMNKQIPARKWIIVIQPVFTCSKSTVETPGQ